MIMSVIMGMIINMLMVMTPSIILTKIKLIVSVYNSVPNKDNDNDYVKDNEYVNDNDHDNDYVNDNDQG